MGIPFGKILLDLFYPIIKYIGAIGFLVLFLIVTSLIVLLLKVLLSLKSKKEKIYDSVQKEDSTHTIEVDSIEPIKYDLKKPEE
jgi:large-conductance mechanosensitive channel